MQERAIPTRKPRNVPRLSPEQLKRALRTMVTIRAFETRCSELFQEGLVKGTAHSSVGQEATATGACLQLAPSDFVVSHHRGHGHCIAKGASTDRMMAELLGKADGYCKGLGGSMHIADLSLNILGANGIVGAGIGLGMGAALAAKLKGTKEAGVAFFGDGANNEGIFHEALNMASIWKLPIVFFCENNNYGLSMAFANATAGGSVSARAAGYGMPTDLVDGNDVVAVHEAVSEALERARAGEGPTLIEAMTYRWGDHSMRANLPRYRSDEEVERWKGRDPIERLIRDMQDMGIVDAGEVEALRREVSRRIEADVAFAKASPEPDPAVLAAAVEAPRKPVSPPPPPGERALTYAEALREAIDQAMSADPSVFVIGEDVGRIGGIFAVTRGLAEKHGLERLRDTPITEAAIASAAVGSAIAGMRPIAEIQIFDFVTHMMDMIVNQAAKFRFMLGGAPKVPVVFRGPQGGGIRMAAQHSQSLEAWFTHVPGLTVLAPSNPYDAKGLLMAAIRDDNPVMFLEHKMLYLGQAKPVPVEPYALPIGKADIKRAGTDVTLVATFAMVDRALSAAEVLSKEGISVEVIDPRTLKPFDEETIIESVKRTNRLIIAHEAWKTGGWGAEVAATVAEKALDWLDAPIVRLGAADVPMPYNDRLERIVIPQQNAIEEAVRRILGRAPAGS